MFQIKKKRILEKKKELVSAFFVSALSKFDPTESMAEYNRYLEEYDKKARAVTDHIERKIEYYNTCDT